MLQSLPHQVIPSPARLGLSNPNSPSLQSPGPPKPAPQPSQSLLSQQQQTPLSAPKTVSSTLLPLLPPLPRAQALLAQMASLASKLFDVSPNRSAWVSAFRGSLPTFVSSENSTSPPPLESSPTNTKQILALFTSFQTQLLEAVAELQEILNLQDTKQKLNQEIETKDAAILAFAKKLKEAEQVLDILVDDYADYRRPKRSKSEQDSSSSTTVASQLKLSDVISYAHRISYTTFAPPEFGAGGPLRGALPPAPQEDQMRASQLYAFADLDVGLPKTVKDKEKEIEPLIETPALPTDPMAAAIKGLLPQNFTIPAGWKPGMPVELPTDLPLPPPGWKPGDPVPLPPLDSISVPARADGQQMRPPVVPPAFAKAAEPIHVPHVPLDILDPDDDSSDYSSDEASSDDED